jgi:activator of HSP90 ATPase
MGNMKNDFTLTATFHTKPETIYKAWLSTTGHTSMTGSPAKVDGIVGGAFTAWDGYIWGTFLELDENKRIVQIWRTGEFLEEHQDSHVEILLEEINGGTKLTLVHTKVPEGQDGYIKGWEDFYFTPMKEYFG